MKEQHKDLSGDQTMSLRVLLDGAVSLPQKSFDQHVLKCLSFAPASFWGDLSEALVAEENIFDYWPKINCLFDKTPFLNEPLSDERKRQLHLIFWRSCFEGNIERVRFLLTGDKTKHLCDVRFNNGLALSNAVRGTYDLETVKFLCESPLISEHANVRDDDHMALKVAAAFKKPDMLRYLLSLYAPTEKSCVQELFATGHIKALDDVFDCLSDIQKDCVAKHPNLFVTSDLPRIKAHLERDFYLKSLGRDIKCETPARPKM